MAKRAANRRPSDQHERQRALDPTRSLLVQAPAGSGKTTLLAERFLTLLGEVDEPGQIVAITFTRAAAAEMRNRILDELRDPDPSPLALKALERSNLKGWKLLDLPAQLRIATIDSFCREIALQQPLLSGMGSGLTVDENPDALYRRAALNTLNHIGDHDTPLASAIELLLDCRDNDWRGIETLLVTMLAKRDKWMQDFVLNREPDWEAMRNRLERPFANAVRRGLTWVSQLLDHAPGAREEALSLARFACAHPNGEPLRALAELTEFPLPPFVSHEDLESAHHALGCLKHLLLTAGDSKFRKKVDAGLGFPAERKMENARVRELITRVAAIPGFEEALALVHALPPARYPDADWAIVRSAFTLLRHAVGELKVVFAEAAAVDYVEVAQTALNVLRDDDGHPSDAAIALAGGIRHLLVDEFQDTSRRQHRLLGDIVAAWEDREGHTCFFVGDPMQSIYFFRDADAELFARVAQLGLEIPGAAPFPLECVSLSSNFRTRPELVANLNETFSRIFAEKDGSGITFTAAIPELEPGASGREPFNTTFHFSLKTAPIQADAESDEIPVLPPNDQVAEIVDLIRAHMPAIEHARTANEKYRVAVLARKSASLGPIAQALRDASIPFRAIELEQLAARPEILDALSLGRALLNPLDRIAWLGVLRAPWCGLTLDDLHRLASTDQGTAANQSMSELIAERLPLLSQFGQSALRRVMAALTSAQQRAAAQPIAATGTWLHEVWASLGGAACCDAVARANLDLLWACLDALPGGVEDMLGPALDAALKRLTALPDPRADSERGVQLMTIHKSKGLEFEVVIVPDLQGQNRTAKYELLSWLERGLGPEDLADDELEMTGEITEFLVAPMPTKGSDSGRAKRWVDRVYRQRETQEMRRILYVAATRAREELHLFGRLEYKIEAANRLTIIPPQASLLLTAWPAFEQRAQIQFDEWQAALTNIEEDAQAAEEETVASIAAVAVQGDLFAVPAPLEEPPRPTILRRLPQDFRAPEQAMEVKPSGGAQPGADRLFARHEGGFRARALGTVVHSYFEELARLRERLEWKPACDALAKLQPKLAAQVRAYGIDSSQATQITAEALEIVLHAAQDPVAQWIVAPRAGALNEVQWSGVISGSLNTVRVDRVFRAGLVPQSEGENAWWIIDYKTAHSGDQDATAVARLRPLFAPQLEAYANILRNLHGAETVLRAGLYYPRMMQFDWWEL